MRENPYRQGQGLQKMSNPLLVLRQQLKEQPESPFSFHDSQGIVLIDSLESLAFVKIGPKIFRKDCLTSFKSKRGSGPHYPLDAIAFLFSTPSMKEATYSEYIQAARKAVIGTVSVVDKKDLVAYVEGSSEESICLDPKAPLVPFAESFEEAAGLSTGIIEATGTYFEEPVSFTTRSVATTQSLFKSSKDFSNVLEMSKNLFKQVEKPAGEQISLVDSLRKANFETASSENLGKKQLKIPIIIVPAAPTAMITMYNAQDFLCNAKYIPAVEAKNQASSSKDYIVNLTRTTPDGTKKHYQVVDNPSRLSLEEWGRVAGVFVHGPAWQFKGWKWENPVEVFEQSKPHVRVYS